MDIREQARELVELDKELDSMHPQDTPSDELCAWRDRWIKASLEHGADIARTLLDALDVLDRVSHATPATWFLLSGQARDFLTRIGGGPPNDTSPSPDS